MSVRGFNTGSGIEQYDYDYLDNKPDAPTKESIGLGNVDNTSDMNKPVSTAQEQALSQKVDKVPGMGLSQEDFTSEDKEKLEALPTNSELETALEGKANQTEVTLLNQAINVLDGQVNDSTTGLDTKAPAIINTASGAIASFADGADGMPVKKLVVDVEPQQDLHGYDNPWPAGGGVNKWEFGDVNVTGTYTPFTLTTPLLAGTYTISAELVGTSSYADIRFRKEDGSALSQNSMQVNAGRRSFTATFEEPVYRVYLYSAQGASGYEATWKNLQIESGSVATAYAPYSNICPISGWTGADATRTGKNILSLANITPAVSQRIEYTISADGGFSGTATGTYSYVSFVFFGLMVGQQYTLSLDGMGSSNYNRLYVNTIGTNSFDKGFIFTGTKTKYSVTFTATTNRLLIQPYITGGTETAGTMNITNIQLELGSTATAYEPFQPKEISVTFPSSAGTVYGATLTVNPDRAGTLVVDRAAVDLGTLTWARESNPSGALSNTYLFKAIIAESGSPYVPKNQFSGFTSLYKWVGNYTMFRKDKVAGFIYTVQIAIRDDGYDNASAFKAAMSGQTLVYEIATPVTYTLTSTEIDGILTTLYGANNIWSDAGDVSVEYTADTKLYIEQLTQPTEDDMTADHAISAGTFFMLNNQLYLATSQIAAGATINPGTNATQLSLADALNQLNA